MEHKWYIGQDIVCIKDHNGLEFKVGDTFTIKGLISSLCKCCDVFIDIGRLEPGWSLGGMCSVCNTIVKGHNGIWHFKEIYFAPLDQDISELVNILSNPIEEFV